MHLKIFYKPPVEQRMLMWVPDLYLSHLDVQYRWAFTLQQPESLGPFILGFLCYLQTQ